jgi:hypothetical protein
MGNGMDSNRRNGVPYLTTNFCGIATEYKVVGE